MLTLSDLTPGMRLDGIEHDGPVTLCSITPDGESAALVTYLHRPMMSGFGRGEERQCRYQLRLAARDLARVTRSEQVTPQQREERLTAINELFQKERELLGYYALRFDGYKYEQEQGIDMNRLFKVLYAGEPVNSRGKLMTAFFMIQRWVGKWGGEYSRLNGPEWKLYRELFLRTALQEVPEGYQLEGCHERWSQNHGHTRWKDRDFVRTLHESLFYPTFLDVENPEPAEKPKKPKPAKRASSPKPATAKPRRRPSPPSA